MPFIDLEKSSYLEPPPEVYLKSESHVSATFVNGDAHIIFIDSRPSTPSTITTHTTESSDNVYPDGGWKAWLTVLGAFLALLCAFGQLVSFGTFQQWYAENQLSHLPPSTISWIGSLQLWVFFFSVSTLTLYALCAH